MNVPKFAPNKRMQSDLTYGQAADAGRYAICSNTNR